METLSYEQQTFIIQNKSAGACSEYPFPHKNNKVTKMKKLAVGVEFFADLIRNECYYVDKTFLLKTDYRKIQPRLL